MHIGRGNQYFKGDRLFHAEVEIFVPGEQIFRGSKYYVTVPSRSRPPGERTSGVLKVVTDSIFADNKSRM